MIEDSARGLASHAACDAPTPEQIYQSLGCEPRCKGCFPLASRIISDAIENRDTSAPGAGAGLAILVAAE